MTDQIVLQPSERMITSKFVYCPLDMESGEAFGSSDLLLGDQIGGPALERCCQTHLRVRGRLLKAVRQLYSTQPTQFVRVMFVNVQDPVAFFVGPDELTG
jgi:hypothetical protein